MKILLFFMRAFVKRRIFLASSITLLLLFLFYITWALFLPKISEGELGGVLVPIKVYVISQLTLVTLVALFALLVIGFIIDRVVSKNS
jgi:hypothetical protein